ncbi:MAG TPA: arsenate reductase (glutaredoxin) [Dokdonella sp.]
MTVGLQHAVPGAFDAPDLAGLGLSGARDAGIELAVIDDLDHPTSRRHSIELSGGAGSTERGAIRQNGPPCLERGLDDPALSEAALLDARQVKPFLVIGPVAQTSRELLPPMKRPCVKEDGEAVIDEACRRLVDPVAMTASRRLA